MSQADPQPNDAPETGRPTIDYKAAGVDLDTYEQTMAALPPLLKRTYGPRVMDWKNGFAGLFRLDDNIRLLTRKYYDPVLVASTDGVGTKLKLAFATGKHSTVGIDLVAMSVNDCLCAGAEPLLFLDYVAMSRDDPSLTRAVVQGVSDGCVEAECALLGGETAILPDFYHAGEYDLAGFCLGVVERKHVLDGKEIRAGDKVIGLASSGLHSNGYSLARKIAEVAGVKPTDHVPEFGRTLAEEYLEPTRIYVRALKAVYRHYRVKRIVHGIAHITGGGLIDNPPRILPEGTAIHIKRGSWDLPAVFPWLQKNGNVPDQEMYRVFNMGIGMVLIVADYYADSIVRVLRQEANTPAWVIGEVVDGNQDVAFEPTI